MTRMLITAVCLVLGVTQINGQVFNQELQKNQITEMDRYIKIRLLAIIKSKINETMATYQRLITECESQINTTVDTCSTCAATKCMPKSILDEVNAGGQRLLQDVGKDTESFFVSLQQSFNLLTAAFGKTTKVSKSQQKKIDASKGGKKDLGAQIYKAADSVKFSLASGFNTLEKGLNPKTALKTKDSVKTIGKRSIRIKRFAKCVSQCVPCQKIDSKVKTTKAIITDVCGALNDKEKKVAKDELIKMSELYKAAKGNTILVSKVTYEFDVKKMMLGDTSFAGKEIMTDLHGIVRTMPTTLIIRPFNLRGTAVDLAQEVYKQW